MTQLVTSADLSACEKNIAFFAKGARQGAAELYGYSALAGREMLLAKDLIPHGNKDPEGGFKKWLGERFPQIAYCTASRWMRFYEVIKEKGCMMQLFSAAPKLLTDGSLSEKDCDVVLEAVPQIMDGKSATAFMRDLKLAKDPEKPKYNAPTLTAEDRLQADLKAAADLFQDARGAIDILFEDESIFAKVPPALRNELMAAALRLTKKLRMFKKKKKAK